MFPWITDIMRVNSGCEFNFWTEKKYHGQQWQLLERLESNQPMLQLNIYWLFVFASNDTRRSDQSRVKTCSIVQTNNLNIYSFSVFFSLQRSYLLYFHYFNVCSKDFSVDKFVKIRIWTMIEHQVIELEQKMNKKIILEQNTFDLCVKRNWNIKQ